MTTLSYVVELEPKLWLSVHLLEGRVCRNVKVNLLCIRDESQRILKLGNEVLLPSKSILGSSVYCSNIHALFYISYKS
ncbi:hypothetical protein KSP39_PZI001136 [Platanthera zijinensis]|uniref:Uncharacterized protein n=1 Tax=Platanthera zijinensis TaxID=2320716 RepID=A0AAP0C067_9ASPA